jgi:hypothetical protein
MSADWYVRSPDGAEHGPIPWETLRRLASKGKVTPEAPVKKRASGNWGPAGHVTGLFSPTAQLGTLSDAELESAMAEAIGSANQASDRRAEEESATWPDQPPVPATTPPSTGTMPRTAPGPSRRL